MLIEYGLFHPLADVGRQKLTLMIPPFLRYFTMHWPPTVIVIHPIQLLCRFLQSVVVMASYQIGSRWTVFAIRAKFSLTIVRTNEVVILAPHTICAATIKWADRCLFSANTRTQSCWTEWRWFDCSPGTHVLQLRSHERGCNKGQWCTFILWLRRCCFLNHITSLCNFKIPWWIFFLSLHNRPTP